MFLALVAEAERDIRARLAERLARADWAPPRLIETLANDDIEVARPVIAASPLLRDEALIRLITEATLAHRVEVAQRPRLSAAVVEAVLDRAEPAVLTALAGNTTADITRALHGAHGRVRQDHQRHGRAAVAASAPERRAGRPRSTSGSASRCATRSSIGSTSTSPPSTPRSPRRCPTASPVRSAAGPTPRRSSWWTSSPPPASSSQAICVRVLKEHQLGLFEAALAKLGGFHVEESTAR